MRDFSISFSEVSSISSGTNASNAKEADNNKKDESIFSVTFKMEDIDDSSPLDSKGRLKRGWQYNTRTGEVRKAPKPKEGPQPIPPAFIEIGPDGKIKPREKTDDDFWVNGGSCVREYTDAGKDYQTMEYRPYEENYEPTFKMENGKLVRTGKIEIDFNTRCIPL